MKIYEEMELRGFDFWGGAIDTVEELTYEDLDIIERYLDEFDEDGEGWSRTEVNDFVWFERDYIAEMLGYDDFEDLMKKRREEDED